MLSILLTASHRSRDWFLTWYPCMLRYQVALTRALSGAGIALVTPAVYSIVADCSDGKQRGLGFGVLHLMSTLGHWLGGTVAILLAGSTLVGVHGWRLVFFLLASLSQVMAIMVYAFLVDTTRRDTSTNFSVCVSPSTSFSLWVLTLPKAHRGMGTRACAPDFFSSLLLCPQCPAQTISCDQSSTSVSHCLQGKQSRQQEVV